MQKIARSSFKQKVVLFFGYCGTRYLGLQYQNDNGVELETVEKYIFKGLREAKLISEHNFDKLEKNSWSRGARTDKGVHALVNGITVKLQITKEFLK